MTSFIIIAKLVPLANSGSFAKLTSGFENSLRYSVSFIKRCFQYLVRNEAANEARIDIIALIKPPFWLAILRFSLIVNVLLAKIFIGLLYLIAVLICCAVSPV